jgi:four helix bundle protein
LAVLKRFCRYLQKQAAIRAASDMPHQHGMSGKSFRDLEVWQVAITLADAVYDVTEKFPRHELYGLTGQMRRAGVSMPSNIAEGSRQRTNKSKAYFYSAANASEAELETCLEVARRRKYAPEPEICRLEELATRVSKMLFRLIDSCGE